MVGNDVVDLGDADTAAAKLHPRFDARVFDAAERRWLRGEDESARLWRWRLWAAKEAVFKVAKRSRASTVWSPRRFSVEPEGDGARVLHEGCEYRVDCARVLHEGCEYRVNWRETSDWVHAVAWRVDAAPARLLADVNAHQGCAPSAAVRELACVEAGRALDGSAGSLQVRTENRIPTLYGALHASADGDGRGAVPGHLPLSLSHHGRFVAFACALPSRRAGCEAAA